MGERKKKESQDSEKEKETSGKNDGNHLNSVILFALGILSALLILVEGTAGWRAMHNVLTGIFGISVIAVPVLFIYIALVIDKNEKKSEQVAKQVLWGIGLIVLFSSVIQLYFIGDFKGDSFSEVINSLYNGGKKLRGGGVASIVFAGILLKCFGVTGARIIAALIACVFAVMLADISLYQLFEYITKPFKALVNISSKLKGNWENDLYSSESDDDEAEQFNEDIPQEEEKTQLIEDKPKKARRKKSAPENDEDIVIPDFIDVQPEDITEPEKNTEEVTEENISAEEDNSLDELISRAVEPKPVQLDLFSNEEENILIPEEETKSYTIPPLDLLTVVDSSVNAESAENEMREKAEIIVNTLESFGVAVRISDIYRGPSITRYEIQPGAGIKVSRIKSLEDDISLYLASQGVRIEAPVPGKACIGIEVPNTTKDTVSIREILSSKEFRNSNSKLTFAVGKDIAGNIILGDIAKMPHVIIAGTTGSGKSVCTRSIIMSILYNSTPDEVRIILIDPKIVEFKAFEGIPQLLIPVVTDPKKSAGALNWAVNEMIRRYKLFADNGANDLKSFNDIAENDEILQKIPQIVIFIDELADLMLVAGKEVEDYICRLAQMGRASGIHLVIATQRPTTDVITGLIKANIPSRIALSVKSQIDSRTIIDMAGADKLLGNGDMLYYPIGASKPVRVQGCFASSKDIEKTVEFVKSQLSEEYDNSIIKAVDDFVPAVKEKDSFDNSQGNATDEDIIEQAIAVAVENGQLSTSMLQRKLKLGYARAARIMDELEEMGVIGASEGAKPRKVLMSKLQFDERRARKL
ncbi:MAG: DNA translocase FtsK [Ruminococcus sp.]